MTGGGQKWASWVLNKTAATNQLAATRKIQGLDGRDRHLRYLTREMAGREILAAQRLPLSPSSPLSILVVRRERYLPHHFPWVALEKQARAKYAKNIAKMVEISETGAAQRLLDPLSSSGESGDSGYSNLPVSGHSVQSDRSGHSKSCWSFSSKALRHVASGGKS